MSSEHVVKDSLLIRHGPLLGRAERGERNMLKTGTGEFGRLDRVTMKTLQGVLV